MVIKKIYLSWVFAVVIFNVANTQFNIQIVDQEVACICESPNERLTVFRGTVPKEDFNIYGELRRSGDTTFFKPIIPFQLGAQYLVVCGSISKLISRPIPEDYDYARVVSIYPTSRNLPENLLKLHVKFSKPMASNAYNYLSLHDERGVLIHRALLTEIPELWNDDFTELSVWIEPGRIKRDLGPHQKLGPVLKKGNQYSLMVSPEIPDRNGVKVVGTISKSFTVIQADRTSPKIENWKVEQIQLGGQDRLKIVFDEPLDYASGSLAFQIPDVDGRWEWANGENAIVFIPEQGLQPGRYTIHVDPLVEDLAGNNLTRLFDRDLKTPTTNAKENFMLEIQVQ